MARSSCYDLGTHLLASVTGLVHTVINSYESGRDAMTSKTNAVASGTVSRLSARYDALGLSVVRTELSSGDGMEMVGEETDDNPLAPQAGLLQDASGGHGPMSTPLESPLQSPLLPSTSFTESGATELEGSSLVFHYTFDLNGNVSEVLDSTGSIAAHYEYGPFGELTREFISSNSHLSLLTFNFSTKYYDAELKTYYYGYRYYDPTTGRWLNRDPIEESGGLNLYGFVGNDAVNKSDSIGLFDWSEIDSIESWLDGIEHGQGPLTNRIDVNSGIVVFSPTMGLSGSLAFYMPIYLFVGAFIKVDCETRMGLCCSVSGKKKGYQETKCGISLGVYTGTFGFIPRIGETLVEDLKICPGETKTGVFGWGDGWVWDGKAFTVGIRVSYFFRKLQF